MDSRAASADGVMRGKAVARNQMRDVNQMVRFEGERGLTGTQCRRSGGRAAHPASGRWLFCFDRCSARSFRTARRASALQRSSRTSLSNRANANARNFRQTPHASRQCERNTECFRQSGRRTGRVREFAACPQTMRTQLGHNCRAPEKTRHKRNYVS